ncbi:alpha-glucosidase [Chitinophaga sp. YR573]|uniref:glycoside hydrolase family 97 protein n=1 Tax=Chitinophaga sp. YR573 TaxID=1881040 RepID=UPI0008CAAFF1|nr:glycoside hydrolase family 97 protein [Chitinophaga sp. YR573]SEW43395.1 alpha-glucosidase [Chitinophaga sp. YR573]
MKGLLFLLCILSCRVFAQDISINSPDNRITIHINTAGVLEYSINKDATPLISPSSLGFEFKHEPAMGADMAILDTITRLVNDTWTPVVKSKHASINNNYREIEIRLKEKGGLMRRMDLFFRAYNDGIAFRYKLYRSRKTGNREITKELTGFRFTSSTKAWMAEYGGYSTSQEGLFNARPLDSVNEHTIAGLPMLIELNKSSYAAITEANINNYPGFYLGKSIGLTTKLAPLPGEPEDGVKVRFSDTLFTPWRVVMLAEKPGDLIASEIIQNLNEPCAIEDPSWIKPGMSAWDHWWSGEVKMDMPTIKRYIDLASQMGWPYMLIDWQWYGTFDKPEADITKTASQLDMSEILRYAKEKNVRCWVWLYNTDVNSNNNFEAAFPEYEKWGIAGVKIDFMDRDDQEMVNWYHDIIKAAAKHHLMVDFHGAYKPDGIIRTYPNMITREGVMGEEYSKFSDKITPRHNVTLPFTRMLAGQMDYTPGGFLNVTPKDFKKQSPTQVMNTRCAELSKFVIYESPFTVFCEDPEHVTGQPGADFLQLVPTVWDDIKVLDGYPGEYIALAKRSGNDWFIGAMTNESKRTLTVQLDFLSAGDYEMEIWQDAKDAGEQPTHLTKITKKIKAGEKIKIDMKEGGGYVARLRAL